MCDCSLVHKLWLVDWLHGQGLRKSMVGKICEKDSWGRRMQVDLYKWVKDVKILGNAISAQEEFNNSVDKITISVDSQLLSLDIPVITQWAHEQNGHGGVIQGLNNMGFHASRLT